MTSTNRSEANLELKSVLYPRQLAQQREGDSAPHIHAAVHIVVGDAPARTEKAEIERQSEGQRCEASARAVRRHYAAQHGTAQRAPLTAA